MSASMEDRLKRRKLDALRRGVHRVTGDDPRPVAGHVVGIGKAGAAVIAEILRGLEPDAPKFTALAVDVGGQDFTELRALAATIPASQAEIAFMALDTPNPRELAATFARYPELLRLEYPNGRWNAAFASWLPEATALPAPGAHLDRAAAKAIYGHAYYGEGRPMERALRAFAAGIDPHTSQPVVAIVFGLGGGAGGGIAADLARHLSNGCFGRRVLVAGIGIAPCAGDLPAHQGGQLYPALNELDCMCDETKNRGVVMSCGELFRNPYTAGFLVVPQEHVWRATDSLAATNRRIDREIAALLTIRTGVHLMELLRLLNWVAAPSTQHSAARTPWGPRWVHVLGFADTSGPLAAGPGLAESLGLLSDYHAEFIEMRVAEAAAPGVPDLIAGIAAAFAPDVAPQVVEGGRAGSVQFILPCATKLALRLFHDARVAYGAQEARERLLGHSWLLEQGVELCEPSSRLEGMAGASLWGGDAWIAVPLADVTGDDPPPPPPRAMRNVRQLREAV